MGVLRGSIKEAYDFSLIAGRPFRLRFSFGDIPRAKNKHTQMSDFQPAGDIRVNRLSAAIVNMGTLQGGGGGGGASQGES